MKKRKSEFIKWMGPILDALRELGGSGTPREVSDWISDNLQIEESKLEEVLKSGQTRFYNQVHWARQYLVWDGLLDGSKRGVWALTEKGYKTNLTEAESRALFLKWSKSMQTRERKPMRKTKTHQMRQKRHPMIIGIYFLRF